MPIRVLPTPADPPDTRDVLLVGGENSGQVITVKRSTLDLRLAAYAPLGSFKNAPDAIVFPKIKQLPIRVFRQSYEPGFWREVAVVVDTSPHVLATVRRCQAWVRGVPWYSNPISIRRDFNGWWARQMLLRGLEQTDPQAWRWHRALTGASYYDEIAPDLDSYALPERRALKALFAPRCSFLGRHDADVTLVETRSLIRFGSA